jgi:hypothetical protein
MSTEKIDHTMTEDHASGNGAPLSRQMTVALTPEQYERLFFQPEGPRRGDFSKRFGMSFYQVIVEVSSLTNCHSQPYPTRSSWLLDPLHIYHLHSLRSARCRSTNQSYRLRRRLLLPRRHCHEPCRYCRVHSRKQYVEPSSITLLSCKVY